LRGLLVRRLIDLDVCEVADASAPNVDLQNIRLNPYFVFFDVLHLVARLARVREPPDIVALAADAVERELHHRVEHHVLPHLSCKTVRASKTVRATCKTVRATCRQHVRQSGPLVGNM